MVLISRNVYIYSWCIHPGLSPDKLVLRSMHWKESALTAMYLQNKKHENMVNLKKTVILKLFKLLFFFSTFVLKSGQPQDFMHFFSSNTHSAKTTLSPYFIPTANQSKGSRASL